MATEQLTEREKEERFGVLQKRFSDLQWQLAGVVESLEYLREDLSEYEGLLRTKEAVAKQEAFLKQCAEEAFDECMKDPDFAKTIKDMGSPDGN